MAVLARKHAGHEGSIMTVDSTPRLVSDELRELLRLAREADSIELKLTVPEQEYRSTAAALGSIRWRRRSARSSSSTRQT